MAVAKLEAIVAPVAAVRAVAVAAMVVAWMEEGAMGLEAAVATPAAVR